MSPMTMSFFISINSMKKRVQLHLYFFSKVYWYLKEEYRLNIFICRSAYSMTIDGNQSNMAMDRNQTIQWLMIEPDYYQALEPCRSP